jgi:outer membrane biosynthesis protein TonB
VTDVRVDPSSGDPAFDRQAELAVLKSSPLPVPSDPAVQKGLAGKTIVINFIPEG